MIPGTILRIEVNNFMTYDELKYSPTEFLNIINGANGTGKSTIICAIILGLGGPPGIAGRFKTVGEYIQAGRSKAKIKVVLFNGGEEGDVVSRIIRSDSTSEWFVNHKRTTAKAVEELTKKYNIQPDNVCQIMPQEKVESFARMNDQQRLRNTIKTIGDAKLYDLFMKLKDSRAVELNYEKEINRLTTELDDERKTNERLEVSINRIKEKQELSDRLNLLKQRLAWQQFVVALAKCQKVEEIYKTAKKESDSRKVIWRNKKREMAKVVVKRRKFEREIESSKNKERDLKKEIKDGINDVGNKADEIYTLRQNMEEQDRIIDMRKQELRTLEVEREAIKKDFVDVSGVKSELKQIVEETQRVYTNMDSVITKKNDMEREYRMCTSNIQEIQRKIAVAEDTVNIKLNMLARKYSSIISAYRWYCDNKNMFRGLVYPPILLELNVKNPNNAKYVENVIPERDLAAFLCEYPEDATALLREFKDKRGWIVNAVSVPPGQNNRNVRFKPNISIDSIRRYGFKEYLIDMIDAPPLVLNYLAHTFHIHNIPVGDKNTFNIGESVPSEIRSFFSENHRFTRISSAYKSDTMTRTTELTGAYYLGSNVDREQLQRLKNEETKYVDKTKNVERSIADLEKQQEKYKTEKESLDNRRRKLRTIEEQQSRLVEMYRKKTSEIEQMMSNVNTNVDEAKREIQQRIESKIMEIVEIHKKIGTLLSKYSKQEVMSMMHQVSLNAVNTLKQIKGKKLYVVEKYWRSAMGRTMNIARKGQLRKAAVKQKFGEAAQLTGNKKPSERSMENFAIFKSLSKHPAELTDQIKECEAKVRCILVRDDGLKILQEFYNRRREIAKLEVELASKEKDRGDFLVEVNNLKSTILPQIEHLISEINERFSQYFMDMKCVGEVSLYKGQNEGNYDEYGVHIRIKFRDELDLAVLGSHTQSGGERMLSIAIYLLSLQDMSSVPFRCIDEISQGMDEKNENRIFRLLVQNATKNDAPQYFIFTPKLPTDFSLNEKALVSFTYNGIGSLPHFTCDVEKIVERLSQQE